jgi:uncharacterized protein YjbI with pentapeptide repeats
MQQCVQLRASLVGAAQGASLMGAQLRRVPHWRAAQGASLIGAQLQGAWLDVAQLRARRSFLAAQGASLVQRSSGRVARPSAAQGASLDGAARGASLDRVQLQGASLKRVLLGGRARKATEGHTCRHPRDRPKIH